MRQSTFPAILVALLLAIGPACDAPGDAAPARKSGTIVSLSPAASELLVAMGLRQRIVGVTGYEADAELRTLPKVGDYLKIDWERLAELKPSLLIVQGKRDRLPPGIRERAEGMGIAVLVLQIDRFDDILSEITRIGEFANAPTEAARLRQEMTGQMETLKAARPNGPPVPALLVLDETGRFVAGRDNYLNDILERLGGQNVIDAPGYINLDNEKLRSLQPREIFLLIPNATDATVEMARQQIDLPAARAGRLHVIRSADALLPGNGTVHVAQAMASHLHPGPATSPVMSPTPQR